MTKRKANQANLDTQLEPRRSRRNAPNDETTVKQVDKKTSPVKQPAKSTKTQLAKQFTKQTEEKPIEIVKPTRSTKRTSIRTTKQAIINDFSQLNKEVVPIKTYGKAVKNSTNDQTKNQDTIKPALKSIKKPTIQLKKKGNLTISSPIPKTITSTIKSPVQQTVSTIEQSGQQKVIFICYFL